MSQAKQRVRFPVVCLCGSAGALPGYQEIIASIPPDMKMAFVIVSHRGDENPELLPHLLAMMTGRKIVNVQHGMHLAPDCIFVAPPHRQITIHESGFRLKSWAKPAGWPVLISIFLKSLAKIHGARSIAIILSGMGRDGSSALRAIKSAGGTTFAQSDAVWPSMPQEAFATGFVDFLLPALEIGESLAKYSRHPPRDRYRSARRRRRGKQ